jgi:histidinol-phosphate aminotransferase
MDRRSWLKRGSALGALSLMGPSAAMASLSEYERKKINPRALADPIALNFNENPFGPSENVRQVMTAHFDEGCRYPDAMQDELVQMIAQKEGVTANHIVIGGGSSECLRVTGLTYANNGGEIIAARPTFLAMMSYAQQWGATVNWVDLDDSLSHDVEEMEKRISNKTKLIFLCNPNNPTSTILEKNKLVDFVTTAANKTLVFSDEAYYDFIEEPDYPSMVELVKKGQNVIVSRTFSKVYGLAGLRIGYLIAKPEIARNIRKNMVANSNVLAIRAAQASMRDNEFYQFSLAKTKEAKSLMYETMNELNLRYIKSHTNFVFFQTGKNIAAFNAAMLKQGVRVGRPFPPYVNWCRVSTGTIEEVQLFNERLKMVLG